MTNTFNLDHIETTSDPYLEQFLAFIQMNAKMERGFGPATALLQHARIFEPANTNPDWFTRGPAKQGFDNATQVLISRVAAGDTGIRYAEGYAMDAELPIPMQHAWLVDDGKSTELTIYGQLAAIRASMQAFQEYSAGLTQQHRNEFARRVRAGEFDNQSEMVAYLERCRAVIAEAEAEWKLLQVSVVAGAGFEPAAFRL